MNNISLSNVRYAYNSLKKELSKLRPQHYTVGLNAGYLEACLQVYNYLELDDRGYIVRNVVSEKKWWRSEIRETRPECILRMTEKLLNDTLWKKD